MSDLEREVRKLRKTIEDIERKREFREMEREHNRRWHTIKSAERGSQYRSTYDKDDYSYLDERRKYHFINEMNSKFGRDIEAKKHYLNEEYEHHIRTYLASSVLEVTKSSRDSEIYAVITDYYRKIIKIKQNSAAGYFALFSVLSILFFKISVICFIICFILSIVYLIKSVASPQKIRQQIYKRVVSRPDYKSIEKKVFEAAKSKTESEYGTREEYINSMIIESENALDSMEKNKNI